MSKCAKRVLVFSDLHANKRALLDIAPVLKKVDLSIFCGDLLGYGNDIDYCINFVLENVDLIVLGDHERMAITHENLDGQLPEVRASTIYTRCKLSPKQKELLLSLPTEIWHENLYITHSINDEYLRNKEDFERLCEKMRGGTRYAFFGHTHEQVLYRHNERIVLNPGSITKGRRGFPRSYALIHGDNIEFVNLEGIF